MLLQDFTPAVRPLRRGDGVEYVGSLVEHHGLYRVMLVDANGRLHLGRRGATLIRNVRPQSVRVTHDGVCVVCDQRPIWSRAVIISPEILSGEDEITGNDCLTCAGRE
jgi:hypothetical protein